MATLQELVAGIPRRRALVVGDAILDITYHGRAIGPSIEDPAVMTYAHQRVEYSYGGASLVVRNFLTLGAGVDYVTVLGDDVNLAQCRALTHPRLRFNTNILEPGRTNTVKERFWANGKLVFKWNFLDNREIARPSQATVLRAIEESLPQADVLVIADNRHGVLAEALIPPLLAQARNAKVPAYVDSQVTASRPSNHRQYLGVDVVCCNVREAQAIAPTFDPGQPEGGLRAIQQALNAGVVVVKLGADGSVALVGGSPSGGSLGERQIIRTPASTVTAVDTVGAGDAFLAALAAARSQPWEEALAFANRWAALSTTVPGPNPPSLQQL